MLEIKNVYKTFNEGTVNEKKALQGINLTLEDGDFVTVIGGNGAGKSTLLNMIAGVYPVDEGNIIIDGHDVTKYPEHKRAKFIGRVFQDPRMGTATDMWLEDNLAIAGCRGEKRSIFSTSPVYYCVRLFLFCKILALDVRNTKEQNYDYCGKCFHIHTGQAEEYNCLIYEPINN